MQENILFLIDKLVLMSGSTSNYETLISELNLIENERHDLESKIEELKSGMTEDKYFDATQEIVDRNIELSISKKTSKLEKEFSSLKKNQEKLEEQEKKLIETIDLIKQKIIKSKRTISIIDNRIEKTANNDTQNFYQQICDQETEKIIKLQKQLEENNNQLDILSKELDEINSKVEKIKKDVETSSTRLVEVRTSLSDKSNYIDIVQKNKDAEILNELQSQIVELENKKNTILKDAVFISNEIKEMIINEDYEAALSKLLELVNIIKMQPYMNVGDISSLQEELGKFEEAQNELISMIENKKYYGSDVSFLEHRINHLSHLIKIKYDEINATKERISVIDNQLVPEISDQLKKAENEAENLEKSLSYYKNKIKDTEIKNPTTIVSLKASYNKKTNELKVIRDIIERYSKEFGILVEISANLETEKISKLNKEIDEYNSEIEEISKIKLLSTKTKDAIEQEKDKEELSIITKNIDLLKHRLKFDKMPQEIYDDIEMYITSNQETNYVDIESETLSSQDNSENIDELMDINLPSSEELTDFISEENEEPEVDLVEEFNDEELIDFINNPQENEADKDFNLELPKLTDLEEKENEIDNYFSKDLEIEKETSQDEEYTFSELEDTDYFSLDDFLKEINNDN